MSDYETDQAAAEEALRPRLTAEFLSTLVQAVRTIGYSVDYGESVSLVQEVFAIAGQKAPFGEDMEPFAATYAKAAGPHASGIVTAT